MLSKHGSKQKLYLKLKHDNNTDPASNQFLLFIKNHHSNCSSNWTLSHLQWLTSSDLSSNRAYCTVIGQFLQSPGKAILHPDWTRRRALKSRASESQCDELYAELSQWPQNQRLGISVCFSLSQSVLPSLYSLSLCVFLPKIRKMESKHARPSAQ